MTTFKEAYNRTQSKLAEQGIFSHDSLPDFKIFDSFYGENHRFYHNRNHIIELLDIHQSLEQLLVYELSGMTPFESVKLETTIWFHDIIYQPQQTDNEIRSAVLFEALTPQFINYKDTVEVYSAIVHTTHFREDSRELPKWSQYMLDLDLAGFGSDPDKFRNNTLKLRLENAHVTDEEFDVNRINFLHKLLERGRPIYYNPYNLELVKAHEKRAQINILSEIGSLASKDFMKTMVQHEESNRY